MKRFNITYTAAYQLMKKKVPIAGLSECYAEKKTEFHFDRELSRKYHTLIDKNDISDWLKSAYDGKKTIDDFSSFLVFIHVLTDKYPSLISGTDEMTLLLSDMHSLAGSVFRYYNPYSKEGFTLKTSELKRMISIALQDFQRYENNNKLPLFSWQLTMAEKEILAHNLFEQKKPLDNEAKAALNAFLQASCLNGNPFSMIVMAHIYEADDSYKKYGLNKSYIKALSYYLAAERQGSPYGAIGAGRLYLYFLTDKHGRHNYAAAFSHFSFAADHQLLDSYCYLSDMYYNGLFVEQNKTEARYLLTAHLSDAMDYSLRYGDIYYLSLYYYRYGKYVYDAKNSDSYIMSLSCFILAKYYYQKRNSADKKSSEAFMAADIKQNIFRLSQILNLPIRNFELPYKFSSEDIISFVNTNMLIKAFDRGSVFGRKGDNFVTFELHVKYEDGINMPFVSAGTVLNLSLVCLRLELDKPLENDVPLTGFGADSASQIIFADKLNIIFLHSFSGKSLTLVNYARGRNPLLYNGEEVVIGKSLKGLKKGRTGIVVRHHLDRDVYDVQTDGNGAEIVQISDSYLQKKHQ